MTRKIFLSLAVFFITSITVHAQAGLTEIDVLLDGEAPGARLSSSDIIIVRFLKTGKRLNIGKVKKISVKYHPKGVMVNGLVFPVRKIRVDSINSTISFKGKRYGGYFIIRPSGKRRVDVLNRVDLETYVKGVVPGEMPVKWPLEALKAQAVAARTYALYQKTQRDKSNYDVMPNTNDQVYTGLEKRTKLTDKAVDETRGMVLTYKNRLIKTYYHSTAGTRTENGGAVFKDGNVPYLKSVVCPYSKESPAYRWTEKIRYTDIKKAFTKAGINTGTITKVSAKGRTKSGRLRQIILHAKPRNMKMPATEFRKIIGSQKIKSTWFRVKNAGGKLLLAGRGYGHGVGMCQWGAKGMAEKKWGFKKILHYYYAGTQIKPAEFLSVRGSTSR